MKKLIKIILIISLFPVFITAEEIPPFNSDPDFAQVEFVKLEAETPAYWKITVTVSHNDQGWEHYADYWKVTVPDTGKLLGERVLHHPHDNEQPFSRSASGIFIDKSIRYIKVSARCSKHGFEGRSIIVDLEKENGDFYSIKR